MEMHTSHTGLPFFVMYVQPCCAALRWRTASPSFLESTSLPSHLFEKKPTYILTTPLCQTTADANVQESDMQRKEVAKYKEERAIKERSLAALTRYWDEVRNYVGMKILVASKRERVAPVVCAPTSSVSTQFSLHIRPLSIAPCWLL